MSFSFQIKNAKPTLLPVLALLTFFIFGTSFRPENRPSENPAKKFSCTEAEQLRMDVTGWAQNFVGTRYRHGGVAPKTGFDCSGFTSYVMKEFEVRVSPCSRTQAGQGEVIALNNVQAGDLVFFGRKKHITHVAMVVGNTPEGIICVHSTSSRGVVVENISTSDYWRPKIMFARDVITPLTF